MYTVSRLVTWGPFPERPAKLPYPVSYSVSPRVFLEAIFDFVNFSGILPGNLREVVTPRKVTNVAKLNKIREFKKLR